jgi:hypothetical protein
MGNAHQSNRSEAKIMEEILNRGYLLMVPQVFASLGDSLDRKVLDGSVSLPLSTKEIAREQPGIMRSFRTASESKE